MDAYVQLALIEKSKRVFAADANIFLGFPLLSPLSYKPQALAALATPSSAAEYAAAADFARAVNFLPRDMVAGIDGDHYLWDVYGDVMARADVAAGGTGGAGGNSSALLYDIAADGTRTETAAYAAYRQYRDAWIVAREDYGAHKLTGEMTADPLEKQRWTDIEEPALRAALARAENDWKTLGHRDEIDAALQAEVAAAAKDPIKRWKEWADAFNPDIDLLTDPGGRYAPTGISPRDFASSAAWPHFDLSAGEMASLIAEAPPELKVILDSDGSAIDHITFEYRSVAVVRPWFHANALTSRIWRSNDPELILSNGTNPPSGSCPAYVSAVVFIRNLRVTARTAVPIEPGTSDLRFTIRADRLTRRRLQANRELLPGVVAPQDNMMVATPVNSATTRAFRRLDVQSLKVAPTLETSAPVERFVPQSSAAAAAVRLLDASVVLRSTTPGIRYRRHPTGSAPQVSGPFRSRRRASSGVIAVATEPQTSGSDEISILAFICKRLPKTPDANPELQWR